MKAKKEQIEDSTVELLISTLNKSSGYQFLVFLLPLLTSQNIQSNYLDFLFQPFFHL